MSPAWRCRIETVQGDRPGQLARLGRIFAARGVSIDEASAAMRDGRPRIELTFRCGEPLCRWLERRLRRSPEVAAVAITPAAQSPLTP